MDAGVTATEERRLLTLPWPEAEGCDGRWGYGNRAETVADAAMAGSRMEAGTARRKTGRWNHGGLTVTTAVDWQRDCGRLPARMAVDWQRGWW